jgi:uncharacterized protein (DUF58 family)
MKNWVQACRMIWSDIYIGPRFFYVCAAIIVCFILAMPFPFLEAIAWIAVMVLVLAVLYELYILFFTPWQIKGIRKTSKRFSLGDANVVQLKIQYRGNQIMHVELLDETPEQFQIRNMQFETKMQPNDHSDFEYTVRPVKRGEYYFGELKAFVSFGQAFIMRRLSLAPSQMVPTYPSVIQMKKYELMAFARISNFDGIKKMRRIGHSYEFEKIRQYSVGDDLRSINWKATGRRNTLMVNQYEDERCQQVYFLLDKSRVMHMPFDDLSLLDYAVNSTVVLSNIALLKFDRVGLISYSDKVGSVVKCDSSPGHLNKMLQALYAELPQSTEANFDVLLRAVKNVVRNRSLLFVYSNFESEYALMRALPALLKLNSLHMLVVVLFEDSELIKYTKGRQSYVSDIYSQTIGAKLLQNKRHIVGRLNKHGIQTILSTPDELSIHSVNKYLELKSKGLI